MPLKGPPVPKPEIFGDPHIPSPEGAPLPQRGDRLPLRLAPWDFFFFFFFGGGGGGRLGLGFSDV